MSMVRLPRAVFGGLISKERAMGSVTTGKTTRRLPAQEADKRGDADQANILDKLARKMLAKMELQQNGRGRRYKGDVPNVQYPWKTMPTTLNRRNPLEAK
jgi:hypothetical protein